MIESGRTFSRDLTTAIARISKAHPDWQLLLHEHHREEGIPTWLETWSGDGLFARVHNEELEQFLVTADYATVNVAGGGSKRLLPLILPDENVVTEALHSFFLNNAYTNFAFCGYPGVWYSDAREAAFTKILREKKIPCHVYKAPSARVTNDLDLREEFSSEGSPELENWLRQLPEKTAILACNDLRAFQIQISARAASRVIPEDLALMGVGNESVICELCTPTLSSVSLDAMSIARTACEWMVILLNNKDARLKHALLPIPHPQQVVIIERESTDSIASKDPILVAALRFIRQRCHESMNVGSVLNHVGRSRNTVEGRFRAEIGRTIAEEILRCRIDRAKMLIGRTQLTVEQIALFCGFATAGHFSRKFKDATGQTPGSYRDR